MTTHSLAKLLMAMPDLDLRIEYWTNREAVPVISRYDENVVHLVPSDHDCLKSPEIPKSCFSMPCLRWPKAAR